ncbi:MAG: L,D-transpeptidase [Candidatus Moraniibacteriota bacterium]
MTLEKSKLSSAREPIVLHFSQFMRPESFAGKIILSEATPFSAHWQNENKTLILTPLTAWPIIDSFRLSLGQGKTKYLANSTPSNFTLATQNIPKIISISPLSESRDVVLGIEDPLKIVFEQSVKDFYIDFRIDSKTVAVKKINSEKTIFEALPETPLLAGKQYTLDIYAKWKGENDDSYIPLSHSTFTTLDPPPLAWNTDLFLRVEEAKKFTPAKKLTGKYIDVNLASQVMTLFEDGKAVDSYIVSSGKPGMETSKGEFAIRNKADRPWSKKYGLYMPNWMALVPSGLFGIHELPEWPGGYKEGANHLGTPVSHGCVRLGIGPSKRVFDWAEIGTPVVIY